VRPLAPNYAESDFASSDEEKLRNRAIRRLPQEELLGIQSLLFRELDHRIAQTRLERRPLPETFLSCESESDGSALVFRGERYDLNITLFASQANLEKPPRGSGIFVVSNGAGVATNTVDQLSPRVSVAGMIDLKRDFSEPKIAAAFEMIRTVRPDLDALVINMISGMALARDTGKAVESFCESVDGKVPVVLRFSGPDPEESPAILRELERRHANVSLADSTHDLVEKTAALFGIDPNPVATSAGLAERVETALETRSHHGVGMDPDRWLTPDRTIDHVFGTRASTRVGILGFGRTAQFQVRAMTEAGVRVRWVVTPSASKHARSGIPGVAVFPTVKEAVATRGEVDITINYAPANRAMDATHDLLDGSSQTRLMILVAENMHYQDAIRAMDAVDAAGIACIGPNSPGIAIVEEGDGEAGLLKLGNIPAHLFKVPGGMSIVGRSGTVIFDIVQQAASVGIGTRLAWAIGGDRYTGLGFLDALVMLEQDSRTRVIVINGEPGGIQEQLAARLLATGIITKPVIALVTGESLPAGVQCGHQGAVKFSEADDPRVKEGHLIAAGAIVVSNPTELVAAIRETERIGWNIEERRRDALWQEFVAAGKIIGRRWSQELRHAYDLLYDLVGHFEISEAHRHTADQLHDLAVHLARVGVQRFSELLSTLIRPDAFAAGFHKSREYVAELIRGIHEIGIPNFSLLVEELFSRESFNQAMAATPWAAADLVNEAREVGIAETQTTIAKTMGVQFFRETLARQPWNTAHAFRSINNMRWWRYVRAYDRYCTHLTGDNQLPTASWRRNPWASVKLVRGYDRMPEGELERALDDPENRALFFDKSRDDPQGLLELGKKAFNQSRSSGRPFHDVYSELVRRGVPDPPTIEGEIERMDDSDFGELVDGLLTPEGLERSRRLHQNSTARALRMINELGDAEASGPQKILEIYRRHFETFDTPSFRLAIGRNLWMIVDLLRATSRLDPVSVNRIVDYAVSQTTFNHAVAEHQWGTSQAFHKIADFGQEKFLDAHRILEDVTRDRECFGASFRKNPRDAVEIVQVVANLGEPAFAELLSESTTREAFLARMRVCPRNAAHFLQEIATMGVAEFNRFADGASGRSLIDDMLRSWGCNLVRILRRINIVGLDDFTHALRAWRDEDAAHSLTPENALAVVGLIKERVLDRRLSDLERAIPVSLEGQHSYSVSAGEIRGLYQSYPEWGDVLFKLHAGEVMTAAERVDLYRLVSGRKRFQGHMVPILINFLPLQVIRTRITEGEPLIRELRALRGVTQGPGHRFDVYFHTLETLDQLVTSVLALDFLRDPLRQRVQAALEEEIDHVARHDLLLLATALHDLGKTGDRLDETTRHAQRSVDAARPILERLGLTDPQKQLVLAVIANHAPEKLRKSDESWEHFAERGGLDLLYEKITRSGENPYPIETILHYHADILGRRGDETPQAQIERRKQVTSFLLERYMRDHTGSRGEGDRHAPS
jgi:succinyl-CoA synthetase alpha subunit